MTRKLSKEEIKDKFDGEELDLSLCNLAKVPVREMVSKYRSRILGQERERVCVFIFFLRSFPNPVPRMIDCYVHAPWCEQPFGEGEGRLIFGTAPAINNYNTAYI